MGSANSHLDLKMYFVDFNYTSVLDNLVRKYQENNNGSDKVFSNNRYSEVISSKAILHIHGKIGENIIIGVDSLEQIKNESLSNNASLSRYCVKNAINNSLGQSKIEQSYKNIINDSIIIYSYGLDFGETDKSRWNVIKDWIKNKPSHYLVVFKYKTGFEKFNSSYQIALQDEIYNAKLEILRKLGFEEGEYEKYVNQIFVIDSSKVLNFKLVKDNVTESPKSEADLFEVK